MTTSTSRPWVSRLLLVAAVASAPVAFSGTAVAGDAPGNNGTLKVHAPGTPFERNANEPQQVCDFYLAGFNFDSNQVVNYSFTVQGGPNNGDTAGQSGSFTVGPAGDFPRGDGRTPVLEKEDHDLRDGRYKVTATTSDGSKSKVFSVNCPGGRNPEPPPGVGGVGNPDDEDEGPGGVGGVDTGGGGLSSGGSDAAFPLMALGLGGAVMGALALRRRSN